MTKGAEKDHMNSETEIELLRDELEDEEDLLGFAQNAAEMGSPVILIKTSLQMARERGQEVPDELEQELIQQAEEVSAEIDDIQEFPHDF